MYVCIADNGRHQESEHMGKHGTRYNTITIIPHEGRHGDANVIPIHIALAGGGGGAGRGGGAGGRGGGLGGSSHGGGGDSGTGNRHQNYIRFIVGGISISIAYLCALI